MSENETNGESFAEMLEAYGPPEGGDPQVGDLVRGTVMDITDDLVFVDTGTKLDGVAERSELTGDDGELAVTVGDEVELYVVARDGGGIRLSKAISGVGGLHMLEQAQENALPVEGRVTGTVKGGFSVDILQRRAFCPVSQMDTAYVEDPEQYVGQAFQFLVIKLEQRGRNVVLSRRKLLEREREEEARRLESELHEGDEVTGREVAWESEVVDVLKPTYVVPVWVEPWGRGAGRGTRVLLHSVLAAEDGGTFYVVWCRARGATSELGGDIFLHDVDRETALALARGERIRYRATLRRITVSPAGPTGLESDDQPGVHLTDVALLGPAGGQD